jgi:hypothetical protein
MAAKLKDREGLAKVLYSLQFWTPEYDALSDNARDEFMRKADAIIRWLEE